MHRLEKNILHHANKRREQRKYLLNNNSWQRIDTEPNNYKHTITLYNDDLTIKGTGFY
jgi:hypothetical protein